MRENLFSRVRKLMLIMGLFGQSLFSYAFDTSTVQITEFMAVNSSILADEDGDSTDWIELFNPTAESVNLDGWYISDDATELYKWRFPEVILEAGEYIVIFASGKNRNDPSHNLHTNFKLSGSGENIILTKSNFQDIAFAFPDHYPVQYKDISYGSWGDGFDYFNTPTPGAPNVAGTFLPPPDFSVNRGFYETAFQVELSTVIGESTIRYTTDGSFPTEGNSIVYTSPVTINTTTPLRAALFKPGYDHSEVVTHSYFFLDSVCKQPNNPEGYPFYWGYNTAVPGRAIADYEMDPDVCDHAVYSGLMDTALHSIPTLSIVTDIDNLFSDDSSETTGGIYIYTGPPLANIPAVSGYGKGWERPASVEYILPDGSKGFQVNCGIRIHGGHSRRPEKDPKHSFRLLYKSEYGPSKLDYNLFKGDKEATQKFNSLVLRGGFNNTWLHSSYGQRTDAQYIQDSWMKDAHLAMGWAAARNTFVHLYLNGLYWGLYNVCEKPDEDFMETYLGGNAGDYDIMKDFAEVMAGDSSVWYSIFELADSGFSDMGPYQRLQGNNPDGTPNPAYESLVDVVSLIDYMLVNFYGGNSDWDRHNWEAARNRVNPGKGYQFFVWDAEHNLTYVNTNVISVEDFDTRKCPSNIFQPLRENAEFRLLFADRVHKHLFNDGTLTSAIAADLYAKRVEEIEMAIIGESARWGDYRGSLFTQANWQTKRDYLMNSFFPARTQILLNQLIQESLYPAIAAPEFSQHGGIVDTGYLLGITVPAGSIYYTLNGSDPRLLGGSIFSGAAVYSHEISLDSNITVKARAKEGDEWSALTEATFILGIPPVGIKPLILFSGMDKYGSYPNPFNNYTTIYYYLPEAGEVDITIYSLDGRGVAHVFDGYQPAGENRMIWQPEGLQDGIYIYRISTTHYSATGKMVFRE